MTGLDVAAPVAFVAGSLVAWRAQPSGTYDPVGQTISTLAGRGATDSWIMIGTLVGLGVAYLTIALGLRGVPGASRLVLGVGAACVLLTALARQPAHGTSAVHMTGMVVGTVAFALWPLWLAADRRSPVGLRRGSLVATGVMVLALGWLCAQAWTDGTWLGVAERALVLTQTVWPLRVAAAAHREVGNCLADVDRSAGGSTVEGEPGRPRAATRPRRSTTSDTLGWHPLRAPVTPRFPPRSDR